MLGLDEGTQDAAAEAPSVGGTAAALCAQLWVMNTKVTDFKEQIPN